MALVLITASAFWALGMMLGLPLRLRVIAISLLWGAVVLAHLVLPDHHALRLSTGQSAAPWLLLGGVIGLVWAYGAVVGTLRARAVARAVERDGAGDQASATNGAGDTGHSGPFRDAELTRYARHIILREIGGAGQKRLKDARVLVIGAGGLGSPVLMYLAAAGVGTIGVVDDDVVDASNLQRKVIHGDSDIDRPKVQSAADAMRAINPFIKINTYMRRLGPQDASELIADYDLILDGTDNFDTRYLVNAVAVAQKKPLISGALSQWEGQISLFHPAVDGPCYQCIFPKAPAPELAPSCAEAGVIGPLPGVIGSMMAVEAVKEITGAGARLRGQMLIYDALWAETRTIRTKARDDCPICSGAATRGAGEAGH